MPSKRESWVRKMQDDYSDAYPVRSDLHPEPPLIPTSQDYGSDWDQLKMKQKEEPSFPQVNAADYRWRKQGKLPPVSKEPFTPYISPIGYSRHYHSYQCLDHQGLKNQKYTTLTMPSVENNNGSRTKPLKMVMDTQGFEGIKSARDYRSVDQAPYTNSVIASRSVPYRGRYDPSGGHMANLQSMSLYPAPNPLPLDPVTGLTVRGSIEEFLDTTYRQPWRSPNAQF